MNQQHLAFYLGMAGLVVVLIRADTTKVTAVELNPIGKGIDLVFSTIASRQMPVFSFNYGKTFVANIVNT